MSEKHTAMGRIRKIGRWVHRELSYLFAGALLVYAVSGICLNHKRDFNSDYSVRVEKYVLCGELPDKQGWTKDYVLEQLQPWGEQKNYTKHYFPDEKTVKVFLKGGSSLVVDLTNGQAVYESLRKRPLFSALNRLHYNPSQAWTVFSDIFATALILITVTGLILVKGPKGLWGRGGVLFLLGVAIPVVLFWSL